jgi:hypothetical protein
MGYLGKAAGGLPVKNEQLEAVLPTNNSTITDLLELLAWLHGNAYNPSTSTKRRHLDVLRISLVSSFVLWNSVDGSL